MANEESTGPALTMAADQRRVHLLQAALDVIGERGFPETRIADVAERAGISPALVIYYFKTKDSLLTEAMRYAEDTWYDLGARRIEVIEGDAELPESWTLWLDLWAQSVRHVEVARVREEFDAHWRQTIADVVRYGQGTGEFGDVDATDFAITLSALLDGFAIQIALNDPVVDPMRAFQSAMRYSAQTLGFEWTPAKARRVPSGTRKTKK
jgi:AcrR family transcriptional regulator